jgi:hypothetical protein
VKKKYVPRKITLDTCDLLRKRRIRMNYGVSRHIDQFSCEGEAVIRGSSRSFGDLLQTLIGDANNILNGYNIGRVFGISKKEYLLSDSFMVNHMREAIGND